MKNVYAFFVAIDEYPITHHRLNGCVNDMEAIKALIEQRFDSSKATLHVKTLRNSEATRANIIEGFEHHLAKANAEDLVFFYFSGHGSEEPADEIFWPLEEDKKNQSIVCWDSRLEGGMDLADKELGYLMSVVAAKSPEVLAIMDCCHSGSGTRAAGSTTKKRQMEAHSAVRAIDTYLGHDLYEYDGSGKLTGLPNGRHVLLAAARSNQTAKETLFEGKQRGVFTYSLIDTLTKARTPLSYQALRERTQTKVFNLAEEQSPQLDVLEAEDVNKLFLDGTISGSSNQHAVSWYKDKDSWTIPIGGLQGIPTVQNSDKQATTFYIFSEDTPEAQLKDSSNAIGVAKVTNVEATVSYLEMPANLSADHSVGYVATLKQLSKTPLQLWVEGDEAGVKKLKSALEGGRQEPGYISLASTQEEANFKVISNHGEYKITRPHDDRPVVMKAKGFNTEKTVNDLESIARWISVSETANPETSLTPFPFDIQIVEVFPNKEEQLRPNDQLEFAAKYVHGSWEPRKFKVKIKNTSDEPLHAAILYLSARYGISHVPMVMLISEDMHGKKTRRADYTRKIMPNEVVEAVSGLPFTAKLDKSYENAGITEATDLLKVFASTDEFNLSKFKQQKNLELPVPNARTMVDFYDDDLGDLFGGDWTTEDLMIRTVQPLSLQPFGWNQGYKLFGFKMEGHSQIGGKASLNTAATASMGIDNRPVYPHTLGAGLSFEAVKFTDGWKGDQGLAILELFEVSNPQDVNENAPLIIQVEEEDLSQVLAVGAYKSGVKVIGRSNAGQLQIVALPDATPTVNENLPDSRKISFIRIEGDIEAAIAQINAYA